MAWNGTRGSSAGGAIRSETAYVETPTAYRLQVWASMAVASSAVSGRDTTGKWDGNYSGGLLIMMGERIVR